jgi:hypothetical protein
MKTARVALNKIFETVQFIAQEGLPFRSSYDSAKNEEKSKFIHLLNLRAHDIPELRSWLSSTSMKKYTHHDIIEEILKMLRNAVSDKILQQIRAAKYYSILIDETSDISRLEQVSICIRYVDDKFEIKEDFIGFYETTNTKSETLLSIIKDVLIRYQLDLNDMRGQCYDGANNMKGEISGLQTRIRELNPSALFVHCTAHRLNLAVQDSLTKNLSVRDFIGNIKDMISFIRDSPQRLAIFKKFQKDNSLNLQKYCPTRWCVRIKSLKAVRDNYDALIDFFFKMANNSDYDITITSKAIGFSNKLTSFSFCFYIHALICIFERIEI